MISVVIPLYNKAHTIVNTLQTVFNQTYQNFEVVIVDDGSTDNGVQLIQERFDDSRIRIITQENAGVSVARNRGIDEAKGEWIAFLDADDEWLPEYLASVDSAIVRFPSCGMILTGRMCQNYQTRDRKGYIPKQLKGKVSQIEFFANPHVYAHISATCIKTSLLKEPKTWNRFIEGHRYNEDFYLLFAVALHTKVAYIGSFLSIYNGNVTGQATSSMMSKQKVKDSILFHDHIMEEGDKCAENKIFRIFMKYEFRHICIGLLKQKDYATLSMFLRSSGGRRLTTGLERKFMMNTRLNLFVKLYLLTTKVAWRMHGYPITQ